MLLPARLLGIHDIHRFAQDNNRGKADGFFIFEGLSILYDATLKTTFDKIKKTQIQDYINQLKGDRMEIDDQTYTIKGTCRQVWIITRGDVGRHIKTEDHIAVKEIPFTKLIQVYHKRLTYSIDADQLSDIFKRL